MTKEPKQGEQNNLPDLRQRENLAANLAYLVVQAHRHNQCQRNLTEAGAERTRRDLDRQATASDSKA